MRTLRVALQIDENELRELAGSARGYLRENPRKAWTKKELKEAARMRVHQLVRQYLNEVGRSKPL